MHSRAETIALTTAVWPGHQQKSDVQRFARTAPFAVRRVSDDNAVILVLRGELDYAQAPGLCAAIDAAELERPELLVLDLADVTFVDAAGMRVLRGAARRAEEEGRELLLSDVAPRILRTFELVGLDRLVEYERLP